MRDRTPPPASRRGLESRSASTWRGWPPKSPRLPPRRPSTPDPREPVHDDEQRRALIDRALEQQYTLAVGRRIVGRPGFEHQWNIGEHPRRVAFDARAVHANRGRENGSVVQRDEEDPSSVRAPPRPAAA